VEGLWRQAQTLRPRRARGKALPRLVFFTDPTRTPDPAVILARLPRGSGVVYRAFGASGAVAAGRRLTQIAHRSGLLLLAGADPRLAAAIGADGVHLPERLAPRAHGLRTVRRGWLVTAAAHSAPAIVRARLAGVDAVFLAPVFESASPSAGRPLGSLRFSTLVARAGLPVYALGGINGATARRIGRSGAAGFAAVGALIGDGART
jgi:thiamine-phosphate pyrophosphorylase